MPELANKSVEDYDIISKQKRARLSIISKQKPARLCHN